MFQLILSIIFKKINYIFKMIGKKFKQLFFEQKKFLRFGKNFIKNN